MFKGFFLDIKEWTLETARIFRHEMSACLSDIGVLLFFLFLPLAYPIVYSLFYIREFVRHADATEAISICGYAADLPEARRWMAEKKCFAVLEIPEDYTRKLLRAQQPQIQFYCDMTLLLRYRTFLSSITELQIATGAQIRERAMSELRTSPA